MRLGNQEVLVKAIAEKTTAFAVAEHDIRIWYSWTLFLLQEAGIA